MNEALSVGAPLLLPPLLERMEVLHTLLPQGPEGWDSLTVGEVNVTRIIILCVGYHIFINLRVKYSSVDRNNVVLLIKYLKRPLRGCDRYIT